ncbi:hypothetical protein DCAR_0625242 [Daucus carota subsp. sativus]|uniref:DUF4408 domain-containing protein n=1 Tax=Daucus carota subsp. sativus TaxID=79200 RepID=A0AAF0XG83_DAUCS|nr:PREDICTED: formin-E-like [Daucus carota subsp. sativus]WOH05821.1 hypothetical protein DCAR_0625242 [Daucus carota subsp. sativus]
MVHNNKPINSSKRRIQILLSLSVLAFISSQYSSLIFTYFSSFKLFSSTTTDRHFIFLLCNGLMLLVIKTSGLFSSPAPPGTEFYRDSHVIRVQAQPSHHRSADLRENIYVKKNVISHQPVEFSKKNNVESQIDDLAETEEETDIKSVTEPEQVERRTRVMDEGCEFVTSTTDYDEKEQVSELNSVQEHEEQAEEEENEELELVNTEEEEEQETLLWSTEELNKKCDDFIRKMKYGIRYEPQLVMV